MQSGSNSMGAARRAKNGAGERAERQPDRARRASQTLARYARGQRAADRHGERSAAYVRPPPSTVLSLRPTLSLTPPPHHQLPPHLPNCRCPSLLPEHSIAFVSDAVFLRRSFSSFFLSRASPPTTLFGDYALWHSTFLYSILPFHPRNQLDAPPSIQPSTR